MTVFGRDLWNNFIQIKVCVLHMQGVNIQKIHIMPLHIDLFASASTHYKILLY